MTYHDYVIQRMLIYNTVALLACLAAILWQSFAPRYRRWRISDWRELVLWAGAALALIFANWAAIHSAV